MAATIANTRALETLKVQLGTFERELTQLALDLKDDRFERHAERKSLVWSATRRSSNRAALLMGLLAILWQHSEPYLYVLWRMLRK
jgi:hypothetical protein